MKAYDRDVFLRGMGILLGFGTVFAVIAVTLMLLVYLPMAAFLSPLASFSSYTDTPLITSASPDGTYNLTAYLRQGNATVADTMHVHDAEDTCIYWEYGQKESSIVWLSEDVVQINGVTLDLSSGEVYDRGD
ncbi:MAG: hypothetical protein IJ438_06845 [Clostridia bacterium]|nr:hypothetical protein [Clostridia bacterium]